MNRSSGSLGRLELGGFTLLLGLVLVLMVGGLVATDSVLRTLSVARRNDDAVREGLQLERLISARSAALSLFQGLGTNGHTRAVTAEDFPALARHYADTRSGTLELALADSFGNVIFKQRFDSTRKAPEPVLPTVRGVSQGDQSRFLLQQSPRGPMLVIAQPIGGAERRAAIVVFDLHAIAATLASAPLDAGQSLMLISGTDSVTLEPGHLSPANEVRMVSGTVRLPDSTAWTLTVGQVDKVYAVRRALWVLGALTLLLLGGVVIRERRQAVRIRERSAELERLSGELLRANRMKSEFLASISHELRTPLNAIVGFVELLKDGVYGELSARQVGPVDRIALSARHLRHLVDQVLDIAKIAAGRLEVHTETISLRTFVFNVASELESLFNERALSLSISIAATLPRIRTDPTHLRQILVNLMGNAVKYTPSGSVALRARLVLPPGLARTDGRRQTPDDGATISRAPDQNRPWIALQIVDSGIGIPPADHERIFDEFEQVNAGSRGDSISRGTGLGLPISRRLARLLGGEISVDSQVGKGSTFTVWISVQAVDLEARPSVVPMP